MLFHSGISSIVKTNVNDNNGQILILKTEKENTRYLLFNSYHANNKFGPLLNPQFSFWYVNQMITVIIGGGVIQGGNGSP